MENARNGINVKSVNNEKDYLKCTSKPSLNKPLNKPAYTGMCILDLRKYQCTYFIIMIILKINTATI